MQPDTVGCIARITGGPSKRRAAGTAAARGRAGRRVHDRDSGLTCQLAALVAPDASRAPGRGIPAGLLFSRRLRRPGCAPPGPRTCSVYTAWWSVIGAGHRVYSAGDVARLYRISLLRRLGFPLGQIACVLDDPQWQLQAAVQRHLDHTRRRAAAAARLCARLTKMAAELDRHQDPSPVQLLSALAEMIMLDGIVHSTTSLLVYNDLAAAHEYLARAYGLDPGPVTRDAGEQGHPSRTRSRDQNDVGHIRQFAEARSPYPA
jgi:DNA-binding transcriptional MerR regulator